MDKTPSENALMLIGVMPTQKDYEIARLLGWYRIPMRMAPKIVDVDYLAFYQTAAFGTEHRWQIETFAEVKGHELTTRRELLRDEPNHPRANEEYYKIQIGTLQHRDFPIRTEKWKRITFLYTTGRLFNQAEIINDLVVNSEERNTLWQSLRERATNSESYGQKSEIDLALLDQELLGFLGSFTDLNSQEGEFFEI
jgi:hypothetical protein